MRQNRRCAQYVREHWPEKIIEVYCPIRRGSREDWLLWRDASELFTFFIDDYDFVSHFGPRFRRDFIARLGCAYGTRSGLWIYPPQRWQRLRWFIPILDKRAEHYRRLADDGGRALLIQGAPLVNPAEEATLRCSARLSADPQADIASVLVDVVRTMFRPRTGAVAGELADIFWHAEKAYWRNAHFLSDSGELLLEPLGGTMAGPPVYLQSRMYSFDLAQYERAITSLQARFRKIRGELKDRVRAGRVVRCLNSVQADIAATRAAGRTLPYPACTTGPDAWTGDWDV